MAPAPHPDSGSARIPALDGLRGVAALLVVGFHYLCLLHWQVVPIFSPAPPALADSPLGILWNGPFAVSVFFVLSGFVMAAAAERRRDAPISNALTRYGRLAIPVAASTVLAWGWLTLVPDGAARMQAAMPDPSPWLHYTYQAPVPGLHLAVIDGLALNFLRGISWFNNVLWTMQIELLGSLLLFAIYWLAAGRLRLALLGATGLAMLAAGIGAGVTLHYLGFVTGAALYEAAKRGALDRVPASLAVLALVAGVALGAPGPGAHLRLGLPEGPEALVLGNTVGLWPVVAATLILLAALTLRPFAALLAMAVPRWLGRISFGLYLLHVPPLYTVVAAAHLAEALPGPVLALAYLAGVLALAHLFTLAVDEPSLRALSRLRPRLARFRLAPAPSVQVRRGPAAWPWVLAAAAALAMPAVLNGHAFSYYDTAVYIDRPDGPLRMVQRVLGQDPPPRVPDPEELAAATPEDMPLVHRGRSVFYRLFGWAALASGMLWPAVVAQALAVAAVLMVLWRRGLGLAPGPGFAATVAALGLVTPLGYFTGLVMPDALTGPVIAAVAALMLLWRRLDAAERVLCAGVALFAMLSHNTHLLIVLGLLAAALLLRRPLVRAGAAVAGRGAALVAGLLVAAVLLEALHVNLYNRRAVAPLVTYPHLVAGLVDAGPGAAWLQRNCPEAGLALCAYADRLPMDWIDFLFNEQDPARGVYAIAPPAEARRIAGEQFGFALALLRDEPGAMLAYALAETGRQLVRFGMDDAMIPPGPRFEVNRDTFPPDVAARIEASRLHNAPEVLDLLGALTYAVALLALGLLALAFARARRNGIAATARPGAAVAGALLAGLVLNAAICGILAAPYDRFQARVIWLLPLAALMLWRLTRPAAAPISVPVAPPAVAPPAVAPRLAAATSPTRDAPR